MRGSPWRLLTILSGAACGSGLICAGFFFTSPAVDHRTRPRGRRLTSHESRFYAMFDTEDPDYRTPTILYLLQGPRRR